MPIIPSRRPRVVLLSGLAALAASITTAADPYFDETKATTFFAFDNVSIPYTQNLRVKMRQPEKHPANPVLARGPAGSVDAWAVQFYGSVIREGDKLRLWYAAVTDRPSPGKDVPRWRLAYAESRDGINWTKPALGLVAHHGSKANNLLAIDPPKLSLLNLKVLHEPDDPDPSRRYKMTAHVFYTKGRRLGTLVPFFSADGLNWKTVRPVKPVGTEIGKENLFLPWTHFEPAGGLYKWDGLYYASGQNAVVAERPYHGRIARAYVSADFVDWTHANAVNMVRDAQHHLLGPGKSLAGEQTHEGVSVWPRGNMLLGVHGIWRGDDEWKNVTIDLGFVLSNDGIKFREAAHEWVFIPRGPDGAWDQGGLLQAQGFENIGDRTHIYYGHWDPRVNAKPDAPAPPRGGVGLATLPRDRFGDLAVEPSGIGAGSYHVPADEAVGEFITKSIDVARGAAPRLHLNVDGLGAEAALRVELLGHDMRPLPGYSGPDAAVIRRNGFQVPVTWAAGRQKLPERVRVHAVFEGARRQDIRFSALYIQDPP